MWFHRLGFTHLPGLTTKISTMETFQPRSVRRTTPRPSLPPAPWHPRRKGFPSQLPLSGETPPHPHSPARLSPFRIASAIHVDDNAVLLSFFRQHCKIPICIYIYIIPLIPPKQVSSILIQCRLPREKILLVLTFILTRIMAAPSSVRHRAIKKEAHRSECGSQDAHSAPFPDAQYLPGCSRRTVRSTTKAPRIAHMNAGVVPEPYEKRPLHVPVSLYRCHRWMSRILQRSAVSRSHFFSKLRGRGSN